MPLRLAVVTLVLPPGGPLVLAALGAAALCRYPRLGRALVAAGLLAMWLASLPIVASALVTSLGGARALEPAQLRQVEAIVILGGGLRLQALEYGGDTLGRLTLERVRYGAHLARLSGLPVLVTGGTPKDAERSEADLMRVALESEFGVAVRWVEDQARNTRENAINTAAVLAADGTRRVLLVLHGFDVRRAVREFEAAGLEVTPAPTFVPRWDRLQATDFLPSAGALDTTRFALYEMLALLRDWLIGGPRGATRSSSA